MSHLECIAPEILQWIGKNLRDSDLAHLSQASTYFADFFDKTLFTRSLEDKPPRVVKIPALMWAVDYGHTELVERILSQPDFDFDTGKTDNALQLAAIMGHSEIAVILAEYGWDIEEADDFDQTALHLAALHGRLDTLKALIECGADLSATDAIGQTPLVVAIKSPHNITSSIHSPPSKIPARDIALKYAMESRVASTVQSLLERGALDQISTPDDRGETPLHLAVITSAAMSATDRSDLVVGSAVIRLLVEYGADCKARNKDNETPIDLAVCGGVACTTALNCFIDMFLDPNSKHRSGKSLLYVAATIYQTECAYNNAELLINRGAVIDFSLWDFFHGQEKPNEQYFDKLLTLLEIHGAQFNGSEADCFIIAVYHGMLSIMQMLFEKGCDINATMSSCLCHRHRHTALEVAVARENPEALQFLIDRGVRMTERERRQVDRVMNDGSSVASSPVWEPESWLRTSYPILRSPPTGRRLDRN